MRVILLVVLSVAASGISAPAKERSPAKPAGSGRSPSVVAEREEIESVAPSTTLTDTVNVGKPRVLGRVDLRPSWTTKTGELHSENLAEVGYRITPDIAAYYQQNFQTNLYDPTGMSHGMEAFAQDGLFRVRFNNVWVDDSQTTFFNYEPRLFLPTYAASRNAGLITAVRNYFILKKVVSPTLTLSAMEIPVAFFYDRSGFGSAANPFAENRIYLVADVNLTSKLSVSVPLMFHNTRYRNYAANAKNNNRWAHLLWIWPEVAYQVAPTVSMGVAYYSDNLIKKDLSGFDFGKGFELGVGQVFLKASL